MSQPIHSKQGNVSLPSGFFLSATALYPAPDPAPAPALAPSHAFAPAPA